MSFSDKYIQTKNVIPLRINGSFLETSSTFKVASPYSQETLANINLASEKELEQAIDIAYDTLRNAALPTHVRAKILDKAAVEIEKYKEDFAVIIASEAAKPIKTARVEVERAIQTFLFSASIARTMTGEMIALDAHPSGENRLAFSLREPIGVVAAIAPFNFPLNLVAHKVAPAIAAGCPVVLKPAHNTPLSSAALVDLLIGECGLPAEYLSFVPCTGEVAASISNNEKVAMISFTGSPQVGWSIKEKAYKKKVALELGNNAPVIIQPDTDLDRVASLVAASGYSFQGQSCISVQRVYAHSSIYEEFLLMLKTKVEALVVGDPLDDNTDVSSLISTNETQRVSSWVQGAIDSGARRICGGGPNENSIVPPTVLADTTDDMDVCRKEVFGPVVCVMPYDNLDSVIKRANDSSYGLQASIFTQDISNAMLAARKLDFGGVLINETPTYRADNMPYGGIRDSGNTKEGPAHAVLEMTNEKLVIINES